DLAKANKLKAPYRLKLGQVLKGKATSSKAYVVQNGDTLYSVAQRFNVTPASLASLNKIGASSTIRANQRLTLPSTFKDSGPITRTETLTVPAGSTPAQVLAATPPAAVTTNTTTSPGTTTTTTTTTRGAVAPPPSPLVGIGRAVTQAPPSTTTTTTTTTPAARGAATAQASGPISNSVIQAQGAGKFEWPVRGDILASFAPSGATGQGNTGIDIGAASGTPVRAAAGGLVRYAGEIVGVGNTVLIEHDDHWVTTYSHLARIEVRINQQITQGTEIGTTGTTGGVSQPQVHFETRYRDTLRDTAAPVDPSLLLPR
ncbi:MAG: peptidase, partial [Caulobacteraceae bacterium]|nr:peptidase [Caulobacteraceae bacterium]